MISVIHPSYPLTDPSGIYLSRISQILKLKTGLDMIKKSMTRQIHTEGRTRRRMREEEPNKPGR
jgi:hypothetical protein